MRLKYDIHNELDLIILIRTAIRESSMSIRIISKQSLFGGL